MSVIRTDQWLDNLWDNPIKLCEKVKKHFKKASVDEIYRHLMIHGMYEYPLRDGFKLIQKLKQNGIWEIVQREEQKLKGKWDGPEIPIYIFPSDPNSRELKDNFNGKSGLAFADKLFLFVSQNNSEHELKALFTHEYNHVCRLNKFSKKEEDYVLLDSIVLEGLAENAVLEQLGESYIANWTSYYTDTELENMWHRVILPSHSLPMHYGKHQAILYGLRLYPKMIGYCVGYYLVQKYLKENKLTSKELLALPSDEIASVNL